MPHLAGSGLEAPPRARELVGESRYLKATWVLLLLLGLFPVLASIVDLVSVRGAR